jgi:SAM-dependent methyltransferase
MRDSSLSAVNEERFSQRVFESRESRLAKALDLFAAEPGRGRLIDVAAGSGIAAEALTEQGWTVSALDISDALLEQVRARGVSETRRHDLAEGPLPFEDGAFAGAFAGEIVEHLVDTGAFMSELARVLAPGGAVVITTPNLASLENRLRLLAGRYPRWVEWELPGASARPFHDQGHVRSYTPRTLRAQLREHGFVVERVLGNWVPLVPQRFVTDLTWPPLARTGDWFPSLSQGLIVKARRPA